MYYICKFAGTWAVFDSTKNSSRLLESAEVDCLKTLFPAVLKESTKLMESFQISPIAPTKLPELPVADPANSTRSGRT